MRNLLLAIGLIVPSICCATDRFVVHEWGVMVRDQTESSTTLAPPAELLSSLPDFALQHDKSYVPTRMNHGWNKPIVYFYGSEGLAIDIRIDTPLGVPLAYFPKPDGFIERQSPMVLDHRAMMAYTLTQAVGMKWSGKLSREPANPLPPVAAGHWWAAAREVPAAWFTTKTGGDRFLFYEATARQEPTVVANVSKDTIVIRNTSAASSGPVLLIVNDGRAKFLHRFNTIVGNAQANLKQQELTAEPASDKQITAECFAACRDHGLTAPESAALVAAWQHDLTSRLGFLLISRLPVADYDKIFPLSITPKPDEVVRVGLVFDTLPGQKDRSAWLPNLAPKFAELGRQLGSDDFPSRDSARQKLASYGDLTSSFLETLLQDKDPEIVRAATQLLEDLKPKPTTKPVVPSAAGRADQ